MTAIINTRREQRSPFALPGLVIPGLGHMLCWLVTTLPTMFAPSLKRSKGSHRTLSAEQRAKINAAEERNRQTFQTHGDHGDLQTGLGLLLHFGLVLWCVLGTGTGLSEVLFSGPSGSIGLHPIVATLFLIGLTVFLWWMAYRRAFPRLQTEEEFGSNRASFLRAFKKHRTGMSGAAAATLLVSLAVVTPFIAPFDPTQTFVGEGRMGPGWHVNDQGVEVLCLLGTDSLGRDLFSRVLHGAKISLSIGFLAVGIAGTLGTTIGATAAYFGGWVDRTLMWFVDFLISFPRLVLLLAMVGIFSNQDLSGSRKLFLIIFVLALTGWMGVSRIIRSQVLSLSQQEFVQAAQALGLSPLRILYRHLIPNALAPVIVYASLAIGMTILVESSLSFLGLGVSEPTPTWGSLTAEGRKALLNEPWLATYPGLCIVWAVLSFNLVGDGLRDAMDPRLRGQ